MLTIILLLSFSSISTSESQTLYKCDFEEKCQDFLFDSYWTVKNVSTHADHTYGNLSGHYITYTNSSLSHPLTSFRTRNWIDPSLTLTVCLTQWIYSGPGGVEFSLELAQGDDLQARIPAGSFRNQYG